MALGARPEADKPAEWHGEKSMSAPLPRFGARVVTLVRQPWVRKKLVVEAALALAQARASVRRRGQYRALEKIGSRVDRDGDPPSSLIPITKEIGWAVTAASQSLPWNTLCLTQALAASRMLSRRGAPWLLHIGLDRDDDSELIAHAWVTAGGRVVVGGSEVGRFSRLVAYGPRLAD